MEHQLQGLKLIFLAGLLFAGFAGTAAADPPALASPTLASAWAKEPHARARLIAGGHPEGAPPGTIAAGVEIEMLEGWKTYWRNPGSSGVPPLFEWTDAENLASADVKYPAPSRLAERGGDTIGYKKHVILPIVVHPANAAQPVNLRVLVEYGVCKDICIPVQAHLDLTIPAGAEKSPLGSELARAFDRVPRPASARRPTDPTLRKATVVLSGEKPSIRLDALFPGGADGGDVFIEAPDGLWIPMAMPAGSPKGEAASFVVDLAEGAEVAMLKGKTISITLVSPRGQSETALTLE